MSTIENEAELAEIAAELEEAGEPLTPEERERLAAAIEGYKEEERRDKRTVRFVPNRADKRRRARAARKAGTR